MNYLWILLLETPQLTHQHWQIEIVLAYIPAIQRTIHRSLLAKVFFLKHSAVANAKEVLHQNQEHRSLILEGLLPSQTPLLRDQ